MSKQQSGKQRKSRGKRVRSRGGKAAGALAAGAAIAAGTQAYAEPIRFDNPAHGEADHFHWPPLSGTDSPWLAINLPASLQTGSYGNGRVEQVQSGLTYGLNGYSTRVFFANYPSYLLKTFAHGDLVGSSSGPFYGGGYVNANGAGLQPGARAYVGFRWNPDPGSTDAHFGWIGLEMEDTSHWVEAFAWGYETELNTPAAVGVPEPGTLGLLALGATAVIRRRRSA